MIFSWRRKCQGAKHSGPRRSGPQRSTFRPGVELLEGRQLPSTIIVTNTADSGAGSLREAITMANAQTGLTTLDFAIGTGPQTITVLNPLPVITSPVVINGASQPGFSGTPLISLVTNYIIPFAASGVNVNPPPITSPAVTDALNLFASGCTVEGLRISNFINGDGIAVTGNNETVGEPVVVGGVVTEPEGNPFISSLTGFVGNVIVSCQSGIVVGGVNNVIAGNVVSENLRDGVDVSGSNAIVEGNLIGTDSTGTQAMANGGNGVSVIGTHNTIGGTTSLTRNVISGNRANGVNVSTFLNSDTVIEGNYIGTNAAGSAALPNALVGVTDSPATPPPGALILISGPSNTTIGGSAAGAGNLISGNGIYGIQLSRSGGAMIQGNKIGTDANGINALPNAYDGIYVFGASNNTLTGNLVSGNGRFGIFLLGQPTGGTTLLPSSNNLVRGNTIGLGQSGGRLGNVDDGVALFAGATNNTIGGSQLTGVGNVISANGRFGVYLNGAGTTNNIIAGNRIGTNMDGSAAEGNALDGIAVFTGPVNNTIGGLPVLTGKLIFVSGTDTSGAFPETAQAGNIISGNGRDGIYLSNAGAGNVLEDNLIGTSADGSKALGNNGNGVAVQAVSGTTIGGTALGTGNVISGNIEGVVIIGAGSTGNLVAGNLIGTDTTASVNLGNKVFGVDIQGGANHNTVGGTVGGPGNTIAFNGLRGVVIGNSLGDVTTVGNSVLGNSIFANSSPGVISVDFIGIDLGNDGPTPNPAGGSHVGPNHLQDAPTVTSVVASGSGTAITVTLTRPPGRIFRIELFSDDINQGRTFLGAGTLNTDNTGSGTQTITVPTQFSALVGKSVKGTATNESTGDTSEFGPGIAITGP
jgi:parallel beta-helix repeat protein